MGVFSNTKSALEAKKHILQTFGLRVLEQVFVHQ